jgi:hypothetical protein
MPKHLHKIAPAAAEHEEIPSVRIALQPLLHLKGEAIHAAVHGVTPVAIHTRTPEGMGIIAAASPLSRPLSDWDQRSRNRQLGGTCKLKFN